MFCYYWIGTETFWLIELSSKKLISPQTFSISWQIFAELSLFPTTEMWSTFKMRINNNNKSSFKNVSGLHSCEDLHSRIWPLENNEMQQQNLQNFSKYTINTQWEMHE